MEHLNVIETSHLPKLEAGMIQFAIESKDVIDMVECAILNSSETSECLELIEEGIRDVFEDELHAEMENAVETESTESAADWADGVVEYELADCFELSITREVEQINEPDFEVCAIRVLAAYAIEAYRDGLNGLYTELAENVLKGE